MFAFKKLNFFYVLDVFLLFSLSKKSTVFNISLEILLTLHLYFREGEIAETFSKIRAGMQDRPRIGLPDLLAAREDALIVEKVSSKKSRAHTQTSLNKVQC